MSRPIPRLFAIRHGETEWSLNGRHTGRTDIPLTPHGKEIIRSRAIRVTSESKLIDPKNLALVYVSPRQRALETFHLLFDHLKCLPPHTITEDVKEWDYGEYEGVTSSDIHNDRPEWEIFLYRCPGGESPDDITKRVDSIITKVVQEIHRKFYEEGIGARDVLIVGHSHFTRVLIARWLEAPVILGTFVHLLNVAILSYNHKTLKEPCLDGLNLYAI
ncbi:histidine phosphatase superfamily [Hysterangium stoloniferum]|nr:histidine phosphatase superfamily [Hysterangium stoloniferum]